MNLQTVEALARTAAAQAGPLRRIAEAVAVSGIHAEVVEGLGDIASAYEALAKGKPG